MSEAEEFEIPLRRPYLPVAIALGIMTPVAVLALWSFFLPTPSYYSRIIGAALIGCVAFYSWAMLALARHPRFSLWATADALHFPKLFSSRIQRVAWSAISLVRLSDKFDLILETKGGTRVIPRYWLQTKQRAQAAATALDERLQRARRQTGAQLR